MNKESLKRSLRIMKRKKWPIALISILLAVAVSVPVFVSVNAAHKRAAAKNPIPLTDVFIKSTDRSKVHLIAHRGFSAQAPENTVAAIEKAAEYGFDEVELDVRQTKDGVWVVHHDADVKAMTDKRGKISSYTYYDLVTCKIDSGANHEAYEDLRIPTLEQALRACMKYNIKPMIEIKDWTEDGLKNLVAVVEKNGFVDSCSVISFDRDALSAVRDINSGIRLYTLVKNLTQKEMKLCLDDKTIGVSYCGTKKINTEEKIEELAQAGIPIVCWTLDNAEDMRACYENGAVNFVTNRIYPAK